ncbi:hypothetical protein BH11BAC4_BH11BAC4_04680 [soil metagenome]
MKLKVTLQVLFLLLFAASYSNAQLRCAADEMREKLSQDPSYKQGIEDMDRNIRDYIQAHPELASRPTGVSSPVYFIPCVVQVITNGGAIGAADNPTDAQIIGAIDYINKVYDGTWAGSGGPILGAGDLQVKLLLAAKDPNNNASTGIVRTNGAGLAGYSGFGANASGSSGAAEIAVKNLSRWDPFKFYNIWVVHKIDGCTGVFCGCSCDAGYIAGYAYFPPANNTSTNTRDLDGTLMLATQFVAGQKTLPHEVGHALNLYHPFQGNTSPGPNTCPAASGDQCADTDPVTNPQLAPNSFPFACRNQAPYSSPYTNPCAGTPFTDNTEKNFMNYTNCYQLFTADQRTRMQASCLTTTRAGLNTSWANGQGAYPTIWSAPMAAAITPTSVLTSANLAGITNMSLNGRIVYSLNASRDGGYMNNATKWYDLFDIQASTAYTLTVTLGASGNAEQLGVWIDYDNNGSFNNTTEQIYLNTNIPAATGAAGIPISFTVPANVSIASGSIVRMRITDDLSTIFGVTAISNTSASLAYGQAEDYPIYLRSGPVPVKLLNFTGKKINEAIQLSWKTAQEQDTKEFQVERSMNSRDFMPIGTVMATGPASGSEYGFPDRDISTGTYFYRLKMIDKDGAFTYSNIISFNNNGKGMLVKGNPFKDKIEVLLPGSKGEVTFRLLDAKGRVVFINKAVVDGSSIMLSLKDRPLSSGIYILEASIEGQHFSEKLIKE